MSLLLHSHTRAFSAQLLHTLHLIPHKTFLINLILIFFFIYVLLIYDEITYATTVGSNNSIIQSPISQIYQPVKRYRRLATFIQTIIKNKLIKHVNDKELVLQIRIFHERLLLFPMEDKYINTIIKPEYQRREINTPSNILTLSHFLHLLLL